MIGVDLVYLPEFKKQLKVGGKAFLDKTFSKSELKNARPEHLAGIWAAKEAVIKALGDPNILIKSVAVSYSKTGQPKASLTKQQFEISIAHHGDYVVAVASGAKQ